MPDRLELSAFEPLVGESFELNVEVEGFGRVSLTLIEADASPWQPDPASGLPHAFGLVFRGPGNFVLPQRAYWMKHASLGDLEIFITPIAQTAEGIDYQAVFS